MNKLYIIILSIICFTSFAQEYYLPIECVNRQNIDNIILSDIGEFGLLRKERPGVPAHYHTGIDIKRLSGNYDNEPIYPIYEGIVISKRTDGPYAQLIIEHGSAHKFWTIYEHIAGISVDLFEQVSPNFPIARFMNKTELNNYGWQFDHFHFEILKVPPIKLKIDNSKPERLFASYTLICYKKEELNKYFYNPIDYLKELFE